MYRFREHHETSSWLKLSLAQFWSDQQKKKKRFRFGFNHFGSKGSKESECKRERPEGGKEKEGWGCLVFGCRKGFILDFGFRV